MFAFSAVSLQMPIQKTWNSWRIQVICWHLASKQRECSPSPPHSPWGAGNDHKHHIHTRAHARARAHTHTHTHTHTHCFMQKTSHCRFSEQLLPWIGVWWKTEPAKKKASILSDTYYFRCHIKVRMQCFFTVSCHRKNSTACFWKHKFGILNRAPSA